MLSKPCYKAKGEKIRAQWTPERRAAHAEKIREIRSKVKWANNGDNAGLSKWSAVHGKCINCKTTETPHQGKGLCRTCYTRLRCRSIRKNKATLTEQQAAKKAGLA